MLMSSADYRESLRALDPSVFVDGRRIESVADDPSLAPGINAMGLTYDYALETQYRPLMVAHNAAARHDANRMLHINGSTADVMAKLEAVRLVCQETGCAQRYLSGDAFNALYQATHRIDDDKGTEYHARFLDFLHDAQDRDLSTGIAMTDAKGDRSKRPHEQEEARSYVHVTERTAKGIRISGVKAIITGAPYMHDLLVLPCRTMTEDDKDFAIACAVPIDAEGLTISSRPAGRPGEEAAKFSGKYGQALGAAIFDNVFVPWERVFLDGEWEHSGFLTRTYATHHRHTCIAARAGFGDLLIGAGALMMEANGLDPAKTPHLRNAMVELIKITEGFYASGVASSTFAIEDPSGNFEPEPVYANIGKLLLATHIYDMHRLAHEVSGGLIVALPTPDEDHNPVTSATLAETLRGRADVPYEQRAEVARFIEDLTASEIGGWYSTISLHGGGSPEAMRMEIFRNYPIPDKVALVERLLDRGVLDAAQKKADDQPGRCCDTGCQPPDASPAKGASKEAAH